MAARILQVIMHEMRARPRSDSVLPFNVATDTDEVERPVRNRKSRVESRTEDVRASLLALLRLLRRSQYRARAAPLLLVDDRERALGGRTRTTADSGTSSSAARAYPPPRA